MSKTRAKISILSKLLSFPAIRNRDWRSLDFDGAIVIGDLVAMSSAPESKWYLSWVVEIRNTERGRYGTEYLLESIEDGALCWWSNCGLYWYDRERLAEYPDWRWSDRQYALRDRWYRVLKKHDAYMIRPGGFSFGDDGSVTITLRVRHGLGDLPVSQRRFANWKKTTIADMSQFYIEAKASRG